jgi:hypothetical protein
MMLAPRFVGVFGVEVESRSVMIPKKIGGACSELRAADPTEKDFQKSRGPMLYHRPSANGLWNRQVPQRIELIHVWRLTRPFIPSLKSSLPAFRKRVADRIGFSRPSQVVPSRGRRRRQKRAALFIELLKPFRFK